MNLELCFFRHGRTLWNVEGRYQGHADIDLDDLGRGQSLAIAQRCREINPVAVISSDLKRCSDVGSAIADVTGLPLELDQLLRERDVGVWSGLTRREIAEQFPDDWKAWQTGNEVRPGGGESNTDVRLRVETFVESIKTRYLTMASEAPKENPLTVVAVTHSGWIRTAVSWVLGEHVSRKRLAVPSQGSLTVLRIGADGEVLVEAFNDRGHLLAVEAVDQKPPATTTPPVY